MLEVYRNLESACKIDFVLSVINVAGGTCYDSGVKDLYCGSYNFTDGTTVCGILINGIQLDRTYMGHLEMAIYVISLAYTLGTPSY